MCGIGAMSRASPSAIPDGVLALRLMALGLEERGQDATGFAWVARDDWPYYWKDDSTASEAAWIAPLEQYMRTAIVHTRFATQGTPDNMVNNHPIVLPGIVLVHNGIVTNDDDLFDLFNVDRVGAVDSEAVAALLTYGADVLGTPDPAELLELVEGDGAFAWIRTDEPEVLHLARLRERPLIIGTTAAGDLLAASTYHAMSDALVKDSIDDWDIVPEGTYMQVRYGEIIHTAPVALPKVARYSMSTTIPRAGTSRGTFTTSDGATYVQGGDGAYRLGDALDPFDDVEAWWAKHSDDAPTPRVDVVTSLEAERKLRRRTSSAVKSSDRGAGGELLALGTGSPARTFTSELSTSVDGVSEES